MPAIAMSPTLSPKEVFENYGLKPNHLAQLRYQKKGPRYIELRPVCWTLLIRIQP